MDRNERQSPLAALTTDPDALERFYREHLETVQRFVARRVDDPYLAADLTADVFVAVIESAPAYRPSRGPAVAWLYGIARHVVADAHRERARQQRLALAVQGRELLSEDDVAAMHARIDAASEGRALLDEIALLPDGERAVLELVSVDGLTVSEAARALGLSPVAARVRLHRARRALGRRVSSQSLHVMDRPEVSS